MEALTDTVKLKGFSNYFFFEVQRALLVGVSLASVSSALTNIAPLSTSVNPFANFFSLFFFPLLCGGFRDRNVRIIKGDRALVEKALEKF